MTNAKPADKEREITKGSQPDIPKRENYNDYDDMGYEVESESDDDDEMDQDDAIDECGQTGDGHCMLVGTEYCDWECPFSKSMWNNLNRKRDEKGRYCK